MTESWTELSELCLKFRDEREWGQFHTPKELVMVLSIEASELLEQFLWKDSSEANLQEVARELADVLNATLLLAHECKLDIAAILRSKLAENAIKYPVEKSRGSRQKYTEL